MSHSHDKRSLMRKQFRLEYSSVSEPSTVYWRYLLIAALTFRAYRAYRARTWLVRSSSCTQDSNKNWIKSFAGPLAPMLCQQRAFEPNIGISPCFSEVLAHPLDAFVCDERLGDHTPMFTSRGLLYILNGALICVVDDVRRPCITLRAVLSLIGEP